MDSPTEIRMNIAKEYVSELKRALGDVYGHAYIFGSVARKTARKNSDVDIMLILKESNNEKHIHTIHHKAEEFRKKYGIEVSPYWVSEALSDVLELPKHAISSGIPI